MVKTDNKYVSIQAYKETLPKLRLLAGLKQIPIVQILDKLITDELEEAKKEAGIR